jgi:hypothetical protein
MHLHEQSLVSHLVDIPVLHGISNITGLNDVFDTIDTEMAEQVEINWSIK